MRGSATWLVTSTLRGKHLNKTLPLHTTTHLPANIRGRVAARCKRLSLAYSRFDSGLYSYMNRYREGATWLVTSTPEEKIPTNPAIAHNHPPAR